jgi:DnaJ-class molecular chaperone
MSHRSDLKSKLKQVDKDKEEQNDVDDDNNDNGQNVNVNRIRLRKDKDKEEQNDVDTNVNRRRRKKDENGAVGVVVVAALLCLFALAVQTWWLYAPSSSHSSLSNRSPFSSRTPDKLVELKLTLEDMYSGRSLNIRLPRVVTCRHCDGLGYTGNGVSRCDACQGHGVVESLRRIGPMTVSNRMRCNKCGGTGILHGDVCSVCRGGGAERIDDEIEFVVPRGVGERERIVVAGKADENAGMATGDLLVEVHSAPHPRFTRVAGHDGLDLTTAMDITLLESLAGFAKAIAHLDGAPVSIERPSDTVTPHGTVVRLSGQGMHRDRDGAAGDLLVKLSVRFPRSLGANERQHIKQLLSNVDYDERQSNIG